MKFFYKIISIIFHPLLMSTYAMTWLMYCTEYQENTSSQYKFFAIVGTLIFTGILPLIPIVILLLRGEITNINLSIRQERTVPYLFAFLAYCLWAYFLWRNMHMPLFIVCVAVASAVSTIIIMIINFKWKISAHLCCAGGVFAFILGISYRFAVDSITILIIIPVIIFLLAISRIELKEHSYSQVLAGLILGFIITIIPIIFL